MPGDIDIKPLAQAIAEELKGHSQCGCRLTEDEQHAVRELLKTKKKTIKFFLWLFGAVSLWLIQDIIYRVTSWVALHVSLSK